MAMAMNSLWFLRTRPRRVLTAVAIIAVFACVVAVTIEDARVRPLTFQAIQDVQSEYARMAPLPNTLLKRSGALRKERTIEASYEFETHLEFAVVRAHYDTELTRLSWVFRHEQLYDDLHDVTYCKGNYGARLSYDLSGKRGWNYVLYLTWASYGCSP